ncbi:glycoside hydrolase family 2 [Dysgonomonas sp. Marseille-P4677]|uniref:sugar-binding domain-containing protein n=1 Tax=Dysgonomonas sp. Marseille-P4677 TaxID=2364790 RepID=UPI00191128EB|nr:sugar-binding domain-containing protein [Dysgonomonas sp. Marseille-P4677]MBK5721777.1 glycoside hydrolase family 2 [Dysgonomonas sp. Marseille-P4677]
MKKTYLLLLLLLLMVSCQQNKRNTIDISGEWTVKLDSADIGLSQNWNNIPFEDKIILPGTTDDAGLGIPDTLSLALKEPQLTHLTRKHSYLGTAWYSREIKVPSDMDGKDFILKLERVIWKTEAWIDGKKIPIENNSLIAPHYFDLTEYIKPGTTQRLTLKIDNRKLYDISVRDLAHAYTNHTQIIWNGVIGKMQIEAVEPTRIEQLSVTPDIDTKKVYVKVTISNKDKKYSGKGEISLSAISKKTGKLYPTLTTPIDIADENMAFDFEYNIEDDMVFWNEFTPELYQLKAELRTGDSRSEKLTDFGLRKLSKEGSVLTINNQPMFLRGTLECNIFPLTGYPPMDKDGWTKVIGTAKEWGLNHLRFHSWCPPEAAFEVADEMGFYLQVELPVWTLTIGKEQSTTDFLYAEAQRMIDEYGNHPSFCFWSLGNELQGDMSVLSTLLDHLKNKDKRHLYTTTSFTFEKGHGDWPEPNDDFFITQWTKKGWVRGQGVFNSEYPTFNKDYSSAVEGMTVPLITHEIGQYAVYPNLAEIPKYTGVLDPVNFKSIKSDLEKKGLLDKAATFTEASGKLAAVLYKEEIERALKTAGISGFQLLDLHDFPGQGTALVGLIDAFWDSKGVIDAKSFSQFCAPLVPLLRFQKATYTNNEKFEAQIDVSNYLDKPFKTQSIEWSISDLQGKAIARGDLQSDLKQGYNSNLGKIEVELSDISKAEKLTVNVSLKDNIYKNNWDIWVYPKETTIDKESVIITRNINEAFSLLKKGNKVLLNPDWKQINGLEGKFVPVFWSPVHFPKQAGSMGILCNPNHPSLDLFPTEMHTNWQWWDLNINSTTFITDSIDGGNAIVEVIDNFANNRKLAMIYEGSIGNGKLIIASCDLTSDLENRPVAKQMLISLLSYMNSNKFTPVSIKNPDILKSILARDNITNTKASVTSIY